MVRNYALATLLLAALASNAAGQTRVGAGTQAALQTLANDAAAGRSVPNDFGLAWFYDGYVQGGGDRMFVPFTVTVDAAKMAGASIAVLWRAIPHSATGTVASAADVAFQSAGVLAPTFAEQASAEIRLSRSVTVPAGTWDIVFAMTALPMPGAPPGPARTAAVSHTVVVPDLWVDSLNTTSMFSGAVVPVAVQLGFADLEQRPYAAMGPFEIVPDPRTTFPTTGELSTFMQIYNPRIDDKTGQPDVTIRKTVCVRAEGSTAPEPAPPCADNETIFGELTSVQLNVNTLPPEFDLAADYHLQTATAFALRTFPAGGYRLVIEVTDHVAQATITRYVPFEVTSAQAP